MRVLRVRDLVVEFPGKGLRTRAFRALDGVNLDIRPGETLGLVGESGSGKTTIGRAVLGLVPATAGSVEFEGRDITRFTRKQRVAAGIDIQAVFQDPYTSLNPAMSIGDILAEPLRVRGHDRAEADRRVAALLDRVRLPADAAHRYPREFSGGQRQRVAIARAAALEPRLIVCDEPVSALDASTQAIVLDLFVELQQTLGVAYLFVSHDLSVIRHVSHRVAVLHHGEIVEFGDGDAVTRTPVHPYTRRLLAASPVADPDRQAERRRVFERLPRL
jgi:peptide/nickel transport system ATP-binding protein